MLHACTYAWRCWLAVQVTADSSPFWADRFHPSSAGYAELADSASPALTAVRTSHLGAILVLLLVVGRGSGI